jgi:hypothetical protein
MTRSTDERGVSVILLVITMAVFLGVAIGIVTVIRTRQESYPYQVQSYQAYALAHAGIEFALRYAKDNTNASGDYQTFLSTNIPATWPGRKFNFGNGYFQLRYTPGACNDALYSRGTFGVATREVTISNFGLYAGGTTSSAPWSNVPAGWTGGTPSAMYVTAVAKASYSSGIFSGDQITLSCCDPSGFKKGPLDTVNPPYQSWMENASQTLPAGSCYMGHACPILIAATNAVTILRIGIGGTTWMWDAVCGPPRTWVDSKTAACTGSGGSFIGSHSTLPWDGHTTPPSANQYVEFDFNTTGQQITDDLHGRPQSPVCPYNFNGSGSGCPPAQPGGTDDPCTDCTLYPTAGWPRSQYACGNPNPWPSSAPTCWNSQVPQASYSLGMVSGTADGVMPFVIQAQGSIPSGTKFYISFYSRPHYQATNTGTSYNNYLQVQTAVIFTVP